MAAVADGPVLTRWLPIACSADAVTSAAATAHGLRIIAAADPGRA